MSTTTDPASSAAQRTRVAEKYASGGVFRTELRVYTPLQPRVDTALPMVVGTRRQSGSFCCPGEPIGSTCWLRFVEALPSFSKLVQAERDEPWWERWWRFSVWPAAHHSGA